MSAVLSLNIAGNPADGVVIVKANAEFFLDPAPAGVCMGKIQLPPLRPLVAHELALKVTVIENPVTTPVVLHTQDAGDPAAIIVVSPNSLYRIALDYSLRVPFGVDPPFSLLYAPTVSTVTPAPVLGEGQLMLFALLLGAAGMAAIWTLRGRGSA